MNTEKKKNIPMNLQFFAKSDDGAPESSDVPKLEESAIGTQEQEEDNAQPKQPTIEEIMAEAAAERAAKEKNKVALDKALREVRELKESLKKKMTAQEQEDEAKREQEEQHNEYVASLEAYKQKNEAKERYLIQGMTVEMALKAAEAEVSGDMDKLAEIQKQHTEAALKAAKAEWQRSIPQPQFGVGEYSSMTKKEIMAIKDTAERQKAILANRQMFGI